MNDIAREVEEKGFAALPAERFPIPAMSQESFLRGWDELVQDTFMADAGTYRFRRYSRMRLHGADLSLSACEGNSIYQELHDNPLNGGVERTYEPLTPEVYEHPFLRALIQEDARLLDIQGGQNWIVGIHMVRIVARPDAPGHPAPEGIHIDAECFTVQHFVARDNVEGGVFSAYSDRKEPLFHWLQLTTWDSVFFTGTTWHGATPIQVRDSSRPGRRDILLIDFDPEPPVS